MRHRFLKLAFAAALTAISFGGFLAPRAQAATCARHCELVSCGLECCTLSDCSMHCIHVVCGN